MIAVIGDSFCADYDTLMIPTLRPHQTYTTDESWVTNVAIHYKKSVDVHGYGGKSWWYSWSAFESHWQGQFDKISAIIFCHSSHDRINTFKSLLEPEIGGKYQVTKKERIRAIETFYKYLYDEQFQIFAQQQYAKMLHEKFGKIKTLHFFSVVPDRQVVANLPGSVFFTPLTQLAVAGINDKRENIAFIMNRQDSNRLNNHLTALNNKLLGMFVIDELENYRPGVRPLDMTKFEVRNPNHIHWPDGPWGANE